MSDQTCKGCGKPIDEGRAYELGGHRWHVDCFRCSNCHDKLPAHMNMLVLNDGTVLCSNCTYECSACHKRISEMAVVTSDQVFCAACFVCRNCKNRIVDQQYARTSRGLFCMSCHAALVERKKELQRLRQQQQSQSTNSGPPSVSAATSSNTSLGSVVGGRDRDLPDLPRSESEDMKVPRKQLAPSAFESSGSTLGSRSRSSTLPSQAESDPSRMDTPRMDTPRMDTPRMDTPHMDTPRIETPRSDTPRIETPRKDPPRIDSTRIDTPRIDTHIETPHIETHTETPRDDARGDTRSEATRGRSEFTRARTENLLLDEPFEPSPRGEGNGAARYDGAKYDGAAYTQTPRSARARVNGGSSGKSSSIAVDSPTLTPDGMTVPKRSQLRAVSPADRSPNRALMSPKPLATAYNTNSAAPSPTQAAAPANSPRSPFNRWWHKHSDSHASSQASHKRSVSENSIDSFVKSPEYLTKPVQISAPLTHSEAVAALHQEQQRAKTYEQKAREWDAHRQDVQQRDSLQAELASLQQQVAKLRDEHKLLTSRNKQLNDMNAELERLTLEKFGPQSLWGTLNPPEEKESLIEPQKSAPQKSAQQPQAPSQHSSSHSLLQTQPYELTQQTSQPSQEAPLVTRLDDPGLDSVAPAQAQFLPLRSAKQWFMRRPNKPTNNNRLFKNGANGAMGAYPNGSGLNGSVNGNVNGTGLNGNGAPKSASLIGDSLAYRTQFEQQPVPLFVRRCFLEIEKRGLDVEGIYRKPGSKSQIDAILEQFAPGGDIKIGEELLAGEIQAVSSAVKQYLRYLTVPVITYDCYDGYVAAGKARSVDMLRRCVHSLPAEHYETLKAVVAHLTLVVEHESNNLMNLRNIAMVFAATLARDETGDREIPDMHARNEATQLLIMNSQTIFESLDELC